MPVIEGEAAYQVMKLVNGGGSKEEIMRRHNIVDEKRFDQNWSWNDILDNLIDLGMEIDQTNVLHMRNSRSTVPCHMGQHSATSR